MENIIVNIKKYTFISFLVILLPYSCLSPLEDLNTGIKTLIYTGDNEVGKILLTKLQQDHVNNDILENQEHVEFLFDHATFSSTERLGYYFSVPLKNNESKKIESYLVFKIRNQENLSDVNVNNCKLDKGILVDSHFLDELDPSEEYLFSFRFSQYKNEGLPVLEELCEYFKEINKSDLQDNHKKNEAINQTSMAFHIYHVRIDFNIDYWLPPTGVNSWALSKQTISDIFLKEAYNLLDNKHPTLFTLVQGTVTTTSVDISLTTREAVPYFKQIMWDYMAHVHNIMLTKSCVKHLTWITKITHYGSPQDNTTIQHSGNTGIYSGLTEGSDPYPDSCSDETCSCCLRCINPTKPNCRPCECFNMTITSNKSQLTLSDELVVTATLKCTNHDTSPIYTLNFAFLNTGVWTRLTQSMFPILTCSMPVLGKYEVRVSANIAGRLIHSNILQIEKQYPSYDDIVNNPAVKSKMTNLWAKTLQNTTTTGRQEFGCYIYVDISGRVYSFEDFDGERVEKNEMASITLGPPSKSNTTNHVVGFFHTHTPMTYRSGRRDVGASGKDIKHINLYNIVGIVYDYIGTLSSDTKRHAIEGGHNQYDPATYYHYGVDRRPLN